MSFRSLKKGHGIDQVLNVLAPLSVNFCYPLYVKVLYIAVNIFNFPKSRVKVQTYYKTVQS